MEIDGGVQLTAQIGVVPDTTKLELRVLLQSCVDVPRIVRIELSAPLASPILERPPTDVELGAGEVGMLVIPLQMARTAERPTQLFVVPSATTGPAQRIRYWRAQAYERRIGPGLQAVLLLTGQVAWGGGLGLDVPPWRGAVEPLAPPLETRWEVVWRPDPGLLRSLRAA